MRVIKSERFELIKQDLLKILKGALIAGVGVFLMALLDGIKGIDFGGYSAVVAALLAVLANLVVKFFSISQYKK